jgi:hypothetical protein
MESNTHEEDTDSNPLNELVDVNEDDPNHDHPPFPSVFPLGLAQTGQPQSEV